MFWELRLALQAESDSFISRGFYSMQKPTQWKQRRQPHKLRFRLYRF